MRKGCVRAMAILLALLIVFGSGLSESLAYYVDGSDTAAGVTITDEDGNTVETDATWESTFPYGTFAFEYGSTAVSEGGGKKSVKVYRLGGTTGKATAYITYVPSIVEDENGNMDYINAISASDISILVEDPLPIAAYQKVGKEPDPEETAVTPAAVQSEDDSGDVTVSVDVRADAYQWYTDDGGWTPVEDATDSSMVVGADYYGQYDFRCVYTVGALSYCTDSVKGVAYEKPSDEVLGTPPDDLELNPEPTYSALDLASDAPYKGWAFSVTFADGEYVKEIQFEAADDSEVECDEYAALTITDCDGGSLYDSANTLLLHVQDNETDAPAQVGFSVSEISVDKAAGTAELTIVRTGGMTKVLTLAYATENATALAGTDYVAASGNIALYASRSTYTLSIDLINDGVATEEQKYFTVRLSALQGDDASSLTTAEITVGLYNSGDTSALNAASILYDAEAVDISENVVEADTAAVDSSETLTGTQEDLSDEVPGTITWTEPGELSPQTYNYGNISFPAGSGSWSSTLNLLDVGWNTTLKSKGNDTSVYTNNEMAILFSEFVGNFSWSCSLGSDGTLILYGLEYTYPYFKILTSSGSQFGYADSTCTSSGSWLKGYSIRWYQTGHYKATFSQTSGVNRLVLGTARYDAHDSAENAVAQLTSGYLTRRYFSNSKAFSLKINTPNDADTAPAGASVFSSGFYDNYYTSSSLGASVSISSGGTDSSGRVFVGSTLKVSLGTAASMYAAQLGGSYAVYLTDDVTGKTVATGTNITGTTSYTIPLNWGTGMDLSHTYTINLVLERRQDITVSLNPSADSTSDDDLGAAKSRFIGSMSGTTVTVGYTPLTAATGSGASVVSFGGIATSTIQISAFSYTNGLLTLGKNAAGSVRNIQYINFNLSAQDLIICNGRSYAGNENIWLSATDLASGSLTFYYYHKDYQSKISAMVATIDHVALYYDKNGNRRIDGYWDDEDGFTLEQDGAADKDTFIMNLDGSTYEETTFEPVVDTDGTVHQYFFKVFFTKNPRCLTVPEGANESDVCQIIPAFVTSITDSAAYAALTAEQKSYRTIVSGETRTYEDAAYDYSADNHLMYTAAAAAMSYVDIPLGGDKSPCTVSADGQSYVWSPDYYGNLVEAFENPEPIYIEHSLAGDHYPLVAATVDAGTGAYTLTDGQKAALNAYLGSFGGNDTFALVIRQQTATTGQLASGLTTLEEEAVATYSVNLGKVSSFPNSAYLQSMNGGTDGDNINDSGENDYSEFSSSFGTSLASFDFGVGDYFSISTDEYEVSFSFGIPLGGYEDKSSNDGADNGTAGVAGTNRQKLGDMKDAVDKVKNFIANKDKNALAGDDLDNSKLKSSSFEVAFSVALGFVFKYNALDNSYYFSEAAISLTAKLTYRYQYRFTPVPIVYVYVEVGVSAKISTGLGVNRDTVEGTIVLQNSSTLLKKDNNGQIDTYKFSTTTKAFNITFSGKLYMQAFTDENCTTALSGFKPGYISSDGSDKTLVILAEQDNMALGQTVWVRFTPLEDTTLSRIAVVAGVYSDVYWTGVKVTLEAYIEAGVGVGVEIAKFELYAKMKVGLAFTLGAYNTGSHTYSAGSFDEFSFQLGLGFRVVLLFFSYEMDLIEYHVNFEKDEGWSHGYGAFGGALGGDEELSLDDGEDSGGVGVTITLPGNYSYSQTFYANGVTGEMSEQSVKTDTNFEVSGYGTSSSGFKLFDNVGTGYDYQVVTVGDDNYLVYTISREHTDGTQAEDYTALALSKIKLTTDGGISYGLVNPVNGGTNPSYILIDSDNTGDLDFSVWATDSDSNGVNDTINVSWVSYKTALSEPSVAKYETGGTTISASNYKTITAATQPAESNYYVTAADYGLLESEAKAHYTQDSTVTNYYYITGYNSYTSAKTAYDTAMAAYRSYTAWYAYYALLDDTDARQAAAAKNTEVKLASFNTKTGNSFTAPAVISGTVTAAAGSGYTFLPNGNGGVVFFGQTTSYMTDTDLETKLSAYQTYLKNTAQYPDEIANYRVQYQKTFYNTYGTGSRLAFAYQTDGAWQVSCVNLPDGQTLTNVEFAELSDNTYYVAYTTDQSTAAGDDWLTVSRLYLHKLTLSGGTVSWGDPYLIRTLYNYDRNTADGVYSASSRTASYQDPYFSNLRFLTAKLDSAMLQTGETVGTQEALAQTFLLFEMNGSTYLVEEDDVKSIAGGQGGTLHPFFTPESLPTAVGEAAQTASGKAEVTIGADGDGNIAAVYVSTVPNTTNNALYISYYDTVTGAWGEGVMLAMAHMGVYEAAIANGWDSDTAEASYYDTALGGGMDQFVFSNIQIALGTQGSAGEQSLGELSADGMASDTGSAPPDALIAYFGADYEPGELTTLSAADEAVFEELGIALQSGTPATLLVITQGTYTALAKYPVVVSGQNTGDSMILPENGAAGDVGIYAVSYGYGAQNVGDIALSFADNDFTAGSKLYASLSFTNTGSTAIRYSKIGDTAYPIKAQLWASTVSEPLASWNIAENIKPGQSVSLSGYLSELPTDLPADTYFYLTVSENRDYFSSVTAYAFTSNALLTVDAKPELGIESFSAEIAGAADANVTVDLSFAVSNRGNADADGAYVQFSYESGRTDDGEPVYSVLDLSQSSLTVGDPQQLETASVSDDLASGVLSLTQLSHGYYREVSGTITVPKSAFKGAVTGSLNLKVEVYSGSGSAVWTAGLHSSDHTDEYNAANNSATVQLEHTTFITAARNIALPLGATLRLPVNARSTTASDPQLTVYEVADENGDELGILYYDKDGGAIVMMPSAKGSGIIHITDTATNTTYAVAYTVGESGGGMNVTFDNEFFTFYDADGDEHDDKEDYTDWRFSDQPTWGDSQAPYLNDLSAASQNAYFTFQTQADALTFTFDGDITVSVSDADGKPVALKNSAGDTITGALSANAAAASVYFDNTNQETCTVTVKASGSTVWFDTVAQSYSDASAPVPADDAEAPGIYYSRVFPGTAALSSTGGNTVAVKVYALDNTGLASVLFDGAAPTLTKYDDGLWEFTFTVSENGLHTIRATDIAGNATVRTVTVDWFSATVDSASTDFAPDLTAGLYKVTSDASTEITADTYITAAENTSGVHAVVRITPEAGVTYAVYYFNAETAAFSEVAHNADDVAGVYRAASNGYYRVVATYTGSGLNDPKAGTWRSEILCLTAYDTSLPKLSLTLSTDATGGGQTLSWSASKSSGGTICSVSLNGKSLYRDSTGKTSVTGTAAVYYGGTYTLSAQDSAGNTAASSSLAVTVPIDISAEDIFTTVGSWDQADTSGQITIDFRKILGGKNANAAAVSPDDYYGSYEYLCIPASDDFSGETADLADWLAARTDWTAAAHDDVKTVVGLTSGSYVVYVRDAQETGNAASAPVTVANETVTITGASARNASTGAADAADGIIYATASGSSTGTYQFSIKPLTVSVESDSGLPTFETTYAAGDFTEWQTASWKDGLSTARLGGLSTGWYQIAARTMRGVSTADVQALYVLAGTLDEKAEALEDIDDGIEADAAGAAASLSLLYSAWRVAEAGAEKDAAYAAYTAAIGNDAAVITALHDMVSAEDAAQAAYAANNAADAALANAADAARVAYNTAVTAYFTASYTTAADRTGAENAYNAALTAYNTKLTTLTAQAADQYAAGSDYWTGVYTESYVYVGYDTEATFSARMENATSSTAPNGVIHITNASGGATGTYQFAVLPLDTETAYTTAALQSMKISWQLADAADDPTVSTFTALTAGWYQIVVRPLYGVTGADLQALYGLKAAMQAAADDYAAAQAAAGSSALTRAANDVGTLYTAWQAARGTDGENTAETAYKTAVGNDTAVLAALADWQSADENDRAAARTAYEAAVLSYLTAAADTALADALAAYNSAYNTYYSAFTVLGNTVQDCYDETPGYWNNAGTRLLQVGVFDGRASGGSAIISTEISSGKTVITLEEGKALTDDDASAIIKANRSGGVTLKTDILTIIIPKGTLSAGDDVNGLIPDTSAIGDAAAVSWTDENGQTHVVILSLVEDGRVVFVAAQPGQYTLTAGGTYSDTGGHWAEDAIGFVTAHGLFTGTGGGRFSPGTSMTRAMLVTVLYRLAGEPDVTGGSAYGDVEDGAWYDDAVTWASGESIVSGYGSGLFGSGDKVSRQDMVTILWRYMKQLGYDVGTTEDLGAYDDAGQVASYAREAMRWAVSIGLISGVTDKTLSPGSDATRAQVAVIFMRLVRYMLETAQK